MISTRSSPYSILGVPPSSTADQIKAAFRKLAKQHHPDLNPGVPDTKMSEILAAYETIMTSSNSVSNSGVALACEVMTLEQLRRTHEVYTIQMLYHEEGDDRDVSDELEKSGDLSNTINYKLVSHPDDSISDFKLALQSKYAHEWGLDVRRTDRYGLASGWEVVLNGEPLEILGNHWFLHTYQIVHRDLIYAIVRRQ